MQQILAFCRAMGAAEGQEELLLPLIQTVQKQLARRLKPGVRPEDCGAAFPLAAAMMVMERMSGMADGGGAGAVTSFTAGDLTIKKESGAQTAKSLSEQAESLLSPWLRDRCFVFRGVRG